MSFRRTQRYCEDSRLRPRLLLEQQQPGKGLVIVPEKVTPIDIGRARLRSARAYEATRAGHRSQSAAVIEMKPRRGDANPACEPSASGSCNPLRYRWVVPDSARDDILILEICGDIDMATAPDLRQAVLKKLVADNTGLTTLVVDLREVTFMGSRALAFFVESTQLCDRQGMELRLVVDTRTTRRPLEASGLIAELNVFTDYRTALSAR